jgi:ATP-dependent Clp protease ATP-binding subunit ClpX
VESRTAEHPMGFGADIKPRSEKNYSEIFSHLHPDDLIKFGLIPEFVGRLPINVALDELDREILRRIITEPKNSVVKQYTASMGLDDVELIFEDDAIDAIADKAMARKTGARGLRSIVESIMMEIMFDSPSFKGKKRVVVTRKVVEKAEKPEVVILDKKKSA